MSVTLHVHGAARTVTGSCLRFEAPGAHVLVDCGMFQGPKTLKALNHEPFPFDPARLDAVRSPTRISTTAGCCRAW